MPRTTNADGNSFSINRFYYKSRALSLLAEAPLGAVARGTADILLYLLRGENI